MRAEHIKTATQIITSCVLLGGPDFMGKHAATIVGILCLLLGNVKERGMLLLLPVMGLLLCSYPEHMPGVMEPALQRLLQLLLSDQEPSQVVAGAHSTLASRLIVFVLGCVTLKIWEGVGLRDKKHYVVLGPWWKGQGPAWGETPCRLRCVRCPGSN